MLFDIRSLLNWHCYCYCYCYCYCFFVIFNLIISWVVNWWEFSYWVSLFYTQFGCFSCSYWFNYSYSYLYWCWYPVLVRIKSLMIIIVHVMVRDYWLFLILSVIIVFLLLSLIIVFLLLSLIIVFLLLMMNRAIMSPIVTISTDLQNSFDYFNPSSPYL